MTEALYAITDSGGYVVRVERAAGGTVPAPESGLSATLIATWPGFPRYAGIRARLVGGAVVHEDTRTLAQAGADVRNDRNALLVASDWVVTRATERAQPVPPAWLAYRQALRDITAQPGFPQAVVWPQQPPSG